MNLENNLEYHARLKQENLERRRREREKEVLQECQHFRPKICKRSKYLNDQKILQNRRNHSPQLLRNSKSHAVLGQAAEAPNASGEENVSVERSPSPG